MPVPNEVLLAIDRRLRRLKSGCEVPCDVFTVNADRNDGLVGLVVGRTTGGDLRLLWDGNTAQVTRSAGTPLMLAVQAPNSSDGGSFGAALGWANSDYMGFRTGAVVWQYNGRNIGYLASDSDGQQLYTSFTYFVTNPPRTPPGVDGDVIPSGTWAASHQIYAWNTADPLHNTLVELLATLPAGPIMHLNFSTLGRGHGGRLYGYTSGGLVYNGTAFTYEPNDDPGEGNFLVHGQVLAAAFVQTSDDALKEDVSPASLPRARLSPIVYRLKGSSRRQLGFSAQQVETVLPEAVLEAAGRRHLDLGAVLAYVVARLNELEDRIEGRGAEKTD
jgi:hypothetical protein